ncbi:MAG: helix-turn-helix domain-containing protein [Duncaniella sp.]|nr:helix-turn-helix domain-containing protein [Duncaniella sp.]
MNISIDDLRFILLNVGYAVHDADWNWADVSSPFARIYLVTEGVAHVEIDGDRHRLEPGMMYMIPPSVKHTDFCNGHFEHHYIHVYEDPRSPVHLLEDWRYPLSISAGDGDRELFDRLSRLNPHMRLPHSAPSSYDDSRGLSASLRRNKDRTLHEQLESRGIVCQLLARFLAQAKPKEENGDRRIQRVIQHIRQNLNKPIDLEELVKLSCMSKDHLIRTFRGQVGMTPMRYIIERKMELARLLLTTDLMPVKSVAYATGYYDHSYFIRLFKKETGVTPMQYRINLK